jgi:Kef-type K+ transport system membrane component KefB
MEAFPQWIVVLIVAIVLSKVALLLARRFGIPAVTIQLLTGILLGPSLLNLLGVPMVLGTWGSPSSGPLHGVLKILAEIGLIQLMFLAGLEVDWRELKKILKRSFSMGAWGFVLTAVSVAIITRVFVARWSEALAMSAIMSASSFGISVYYFSETKTLGSRVALMVLGGAILSGLLAILLMIASQAMNYAVAFGAFKMTIAVSWFLGKLIMFFAVAYFLTSRYLKLVAKTGFSRNVPRPAYGGIGGGKGHNTEENYLTGKPRARAGELPKRPRQMLIGYLLLVAALYAWAAMHFGSFAAAGVASLGGALLGISNVEVKKKITGGFESALASIPIGALFVVIGMEVNVKEASTSIIFLSVLATAVIVAKSIGSWIATRKQFESSHERALIMFGVLAQGEIGVLIAAYLFSRALVNPTSFNAAILVVILLTMVSPLLMKMTSMEWRREEMTVAPYKNSPPP